MKTRVLFGKWLISALTSGLLLLAANVARSQDNSACLACHDDPDISAERNGKTVTLTVLGGKFAKFAHGKLKCVQCHEGFNPDDIPHKSRITPVNCMKCHKDPVSIHVFHPQIAKATGTGGAPDYNCKGCHGSHYAEEVMSPGFKFNDNNIVNACGECHNNEKTIFTGSGHYQARQSDGGKSVNCLSCHNSPVSQGYGKNPSELKKSQVRLCLNCHVESGAIKGGAISGHKVDLGRSNHGSAIISGMKAAPVCFDCHGVHDIMNKDSARSRINRQNAGMICGKCHLGISSEFKSSVHGLALSGQNADAPSCVYCHSEHNAKIPVADVQNIVAGGAEGGMANCVSCHSNPEIASRNNMKTIDQGHRWLTASKKHLQSVKCTECHSSNTHSDMSHDILPPGKAVKKCDNCHANSTDMKTVLARDEKLRSIQKHGLIGGIFSAEAYTNNISGNLLIEIISWIFFILIIAALGTHAFLRYYFRKVSAARTKNTGESK